MQTETKKPKPGRPKTFERGHVINVAMRAYWEEGQSAVSLNSVCQRANVAKTSLYKEFGSEDGLKQAVLVDYHQMTLAPVLEKLDGRQPFQEALNTLREDILLDHATHGMPPGCLFVDMCQCQPDLGPLTSAQVDDFRALSIRTFETWIKRAIATGELTLTVSAHTTAVYIDAQISTAMTLQRQGAPQDDVSAVFTLALSIFE